MFLRRLFTILIVIISLLDVAPVVVYRSTDHQFCHGKYKIWFCSKNEKCGTTSNSCINDSYSNELSSAGSTLKGILGIFIWFGLCICIPCCRAHRRKQAEKRFIRQVQTAVAQNVQQRIVYVIADPPVTSTPLTHEESPPAYEQIMEMRQS